MILIYGSKDEGWHPARDIAQRWSIPHRSNRSHCHDRFD